MSDQLQKFMFDAAPVRGEYVSLDATWRAVLERHDYPPAVRHLLGEMMAAAALLTANVKFDGALILQLHGDGPVSMAVVECNADLTMRATAKYTGDIPDDATLKALVNVHGRAHFAITLDPREKQPGQQPYQGVVPLSDEHGALPDMASVLEHYMHHSEQLDTRLWLACDDNHAVGMLLQKLPGHGGTAGTGAERAPELDEDTWNRVCQLGNTLQRDEMLSTDRETMLHRLFWEEAVRVFEPQVTSFRCTCSRERVANMLRTLGEAEVMSVFDERPNVEVACEFCRQTYHFDKVDAAQLFTEQSHAAPSAQH
ncbi:Hsp33 chaperonin [Pandoraea morbifera]|uniref:Hsp33 chaperonin n=1 Tax=Pandoraea morbifera TaxID=2508300 RepID=A0A5E4VEQ9_9BURK|nr:Hsp33 family molecular chaperone HslO [Pandoraea morbifera]VVE09829.1 Hsp33 chaperonin [Pandoraea morbifera]